MSIQFLREIDRIKQHLLTVGARVEMAVGRAVRAVHEREYELAEDVIRADDDIDRDEVEIEEECLKILALHQPVAHDLRFIIAVLKINNDLERIGDLAVNIAEKSMLLNLRPNAPTPFDFRRAVDRVQWMLQSSLDALVQEDSPLAYKVLDADEEVDEIHREMYSHVEKGIRANPDDVEQLIQYLGVSRALERIADHTTNIAEDVIYLIDGTIVRHKHGTQVPPVPRPRADD